MTPDIKNVICFRIQPSNKGGVDFCALKAGDKKIA
jgi:hypothetical protein